MSKPRIAVIGIPGKWSTEVLADALAERTGFRRVVDMATVSLDLEREQLLHEGQDLCELDGLIVKKISSEYSPATLDRLELLRVAESRGVRVFSGVDNMLGLVNRLACTTQLREAGAPMPATCISENPQAIRDAVHAYGTAVAKPLFSTKARGMKIWQASDDDLDAKIASYQRNHPMVYVQQKLDLCGQDLGMVFLGGEYLCTYARVASGEAWNTTIDSGGRYAAYQPDAALIQLADNAQAPFAMDFTTVDVALTAQGPVVFEVSAFGGFRGAREGAGVNAASAYADYALDALQGGPDL